MTFDIYEAYSCLTRLH